MQDDLAVRDGGQVQVGLVMPHFSQDDARGGRAPRRYLQPKSSVPDGDFQVPREDGRKHGGDAHHVPQRRRHEGEEKCSEDDEHACHY